LALVSADQPPPVLLPLIGSPGAPPPRWRGPATALRLPAVAHGVSSPWSPGRREQGSNELWRCSALSCSLGSCHSSYRLLRPWAHSAQWLSSGGNKMCLRRHTHHSRWHTKACCATIVDDCGGGASTSLLGVLRLPIWCHLLIFAMKTVGDVGRKYHARYMEVPYLCTFSLTWCSWAHSPPCSSCVGGGFVGKVSCPVRGEALASASIHRRAYLQP
jgi:hypothetical protein